MRDLSENNKYGLRLSAWVKDSKYVRKFAKDFSYSGLLRINSRHVGFSIGLSTHGGIKLSGGPFGGMNYVWEKTSHLQGISIFKNK
jgi:acyl-CoA reductase-like NAD-dependent aldehyde dehydrogenase